MYLCYLDESGTPEIPGTTSHYVLAGLAVPIWQWKKCDEQIEVIRKKYGLQDGELHTAWILRAYPEQRKIAGFESLTRAQRKLAVEQWRTGELLRLKKNPNDSKKYRQQKKNFSKTLPYVHLTYDERRNLMEDVASCVGGWGFARLFAECIDKRHFVPTSISQSPDEEALEQVVSRFEHYLSVRSKSSPDKLLGLLIHDNNETVAKKHTKMLQKFHRQGTVWTDLNHIMETPLFVNSELTGMVQIADLCGYALRRHLENNEDWLIDILLQRADRKGDRVVGVRHKSPLGCGCKICYSRGRDGTVPAMAST